MKKTIRFTLNGAPTSVEVDDSRALLWVLRTDLGLTGTKYGCGEFYCGACTVLLDGEAVRSCQTPMLIVQEKSVVTIEGLENDGKLHPLQRAFMQNDALQCGYCTPGMIMAAYAFLQKSTDPTPSNIIAALESNLCRCGAHSRIITAVQEAAKELKGGV